MISGVNTENASLMQLLLASMRNSSALSANKDSETTDLIGSSDKAPKSDFLTCLQNKFSSIDSDSDSSISKDEFDNFMVSNKPMGPPPGLEIKDLVSPVDNNSKAGGVKKGADKIFDELDSNKDGVVSKEELADAMSEGSVKASAANSSAGSKDAFTTVFQQFLNSDKSNTLINEFKQKLSDMYKNSNMANGLVKSALDLAL